MGRACSTHEKCWKLRLKIIVEGINREMQEIILKRILEEPLSSSIIINDKRIVKLLSCYWFPSSATSLK
jgi:hypothetical protein